MIDYTERHIYTDPKITIEEQLHMYEKHPEKNERCSILWNAWQQNRRWLSQLLELTIASFPAYSRHNESHAKAVLYNIERILGEDRVRKLSPTDCFALLHAVYIHDIGMAILADDRDKMIVSDEFAEMVEELFDDSDYDLKKAAKQLKRVCYKYHSNHDLVDTGGEEFLREQKIIYQEKLHTYYAIIQLMSEFQRGKHGEKAHTKITSWIGEQDKLRSEFAMSGIPMRIFFRIADCASLHTDWDFQHVMDLPYEENGYEHDMLHPRFIAVMLLLGDALDIDNDRFHPFAQAFLGKLPNQSQAHYDKHMAIRTLKVTPEEIVIEADCISRDAMRLVRQECDGLEKLLEVSSYHWSTIAPRELSGALPTLKSPKLLLHGTEIPADLAMMKFQISQRKAFSILQGENIYSGRFPFVRELLQNAIDSTKIQCWTDYISSSKFRYKKSRENNCLPSIMDVAQIVNPIEYPIEIEILCGKKNEKNEWIELDFSEMNNCEEEKEKYGILFCIKDYGTGISTEVLRDIAEVGTSYKKRRRKIRNIPEWLRPTGEFGIGLQSVFLVSDSFTCETYTRKGERYRIEFRSGANGEHGYINVEPKDNEEEPIPFGTEFMVFIAHDKKLKKDDFIEAWQGYDPFGEQYQQDAIRRDIVDLTSQLILDIEKQLGELLFPIYVHVNFPFKQFFNKRLSHKIQKLTLDTTKNFAKHHEAELKNHVSWIYDFMDRKDGSFQKFNMSNGICAFDFLSMKLYIWLDNISTCARLGAERISTGLSGKRKLCQIYFKGIWAEEKKINGDAELLEMIDIKGGKMENSFLQLNRNGFTSKGNDHIEKIIVVQILESAREALGIIARESVAGQNRFAEIVKNSFGQVIKDIQLKKSYPLRNWQEQLLGFSLFYHFYMMYSQKRTTEMISEKIFTERKQWTKALCNIEEMKDAIASLSTMAGITDIAVPFLEIRGSRSFTSLKTEKINVAEFFNHSNHFLIISKRSVKGEEWRNYLVKLCQTDDDCDIIKKISQPVHSEADIQQNSKWLEEWGKCIIENVIGIIGESTLEQSKFLNKMMEYVPIIGVFADPVGNIRVHVISGNQLEYIYYDNNSKFLNMKRMLERHEKLNAERFILFPYYGFQMIRTIGVPNDVCSIHETYFFDMGCRMLFPCCGKALEEIFESYNHIELNSTLKEIGAELKNICNFSDEYFSKYDILPLDFLDDVRKEYSFLKRRPYSPQKILDLIRDGYRLVLNGRLKELLPPKDHPKEVTQSTVSINNELPSCEELRDISKTMLREIMADYEYIINGGQEKEMSAECREFLDRILSYCILWENSYRQKSKQMISDIVREVKYDFWDSSSEKKQMIAWTVNHTSQDEDIVTEMYEKMWEDIENVLCNAWNRIDDLQNNWEILDIISEVQNGEQHRTN